MNLLTVVFPFCFLHHTGTQQGAPQSVVIRNIGSGGTGQNLVITINQGSNTMPTQVVITPEVVQGCTHTHGMVQPQSQVLPQGVIQQPQVQIIGNSVQSGTVQVGEGGVTVPQQRVIQTDGQPQIQVVTNSCHHQVAGGAVAPQAGLLSNARTAGVAHVTQAVAAQGVAPNQRIIQIPVTGSGQVLQQSLGQQSVGIGQQNIGVGQQNIGVGQQNVGLGQQTVSVGQQSIRLGLQNVSVGQQNVGVGQQNVNVAQQTVNLGQQNPNLGHVLQQTVAGQQNTTDFIDVPLTQVLTKDATGNVMPLMPSQNVLAAYPIPVQQSVMQMVQVPQTIASKNPLTPVVVQQSELPQQQSNTNQQPQDLRTTNRENIQSVITTEADSETMALATTMADQIIDNLLESATMSDAKEAVDCETCCSRCKCRCNCMCSSKHSPSTTAQLEMNTPTFEVSSPPSFS